MQKCFRGEEGLKWNPCSKECILSFKYKTKEQKQKLNIREICKKKKKKKKKKKFIKKMKKKKK